MLGSPVSHPFGVFQGRSERFSESVDAQPTKPITAVSRNHTNSQRELTGSVFISGCRMSRNDQITFHEFANLPAGNDVGHAPVLLNAAHADLGDQHSVPVDQQFPILQYSLVFPNIEHNEIPLRITDQHFALKPGR